MNAPESELAALYRAVVFEHGRNPRHASLPAGSSCKAERDNPFCGDQVVIGVRLDAGVIVEVGFEGEGCLISVAAASLLCEAARGRSRAAARALCERYLTLVAARVEQWPAELGELAAFSAVARFPARESCATLACVALAAALANDAAL